MHSDKTSSGLQYRCIAFFDQAFSLVGWISQPKRVSTRFIFDLACSLPTSLLDHRNNTLWRTITARARISSPSLNHPAPDVLIISRVIKLENSICRQLSCLGLASACCKRFPIPHRVVQTMTEHILLIRPARSPRQHRCEDRASHLHNEFLDVASIGHWHPHIHGAITVGISWLWQWASGGRRDNDSSGDPSSMVHIARNVRSGKKSHLLEEVATVNTRVTVNQNRRLPQIRCCWIRNRAVS
jgi:hypothetical protein